MEPIIISLIAFAVILLGALLGVVLKGILPQHHLSDESKTVISLGTGMIATLAALVLGLLISSAKGTFDTISKELTETGAKITLLDEALSRYGPETTEARAVLANAVLTSIKRIWPEDKKMAASPRTTSTILEVQRALERLSPQNDTQRSLHSRALEIAQDMASARSLLLQQQVQRTLPTPFIVILVFWLTIIFLSFGLFSPRNATVIGVLVACALSVCGSLFLILEMDRPAEGLMKVSDAPLRNALLNLGH